MRLHDEKSVQSVWSRLSRFQRECSKAVLEKLSQLQVEAEVAAEGSDEDYLRITATETVPRIEIYVYDDEAGFYCGESWTICEAPDFSSPDDLQTELLQRLAGVLAGHEKSPEST